MQEQIKVPPAGESVTEATISQIFKESGSIVQMDDELFEMETDKVNQVIYAPKAGLLEHSLKVDDVVKIDQVIGTIDTDKAKDVLKEEAPPEKLEAKQEAPEEPVPAKKPEVKEQAPKQETPVKEEPVEKQAETPKSDDREKRVRMRGMRRVIAKKLVESKNQTAMLTTFNEIDMSAVIEIRKKEQENFVKTHGVKLGFMSFFVKACTFALQKHPEINAYIDGEEIVYRNYFDIGVAVGSEKGLFVPVIRNCDQLSFADIEKTLKDLSSQAREGTISLDSLQGGSFTISNGGVYGSLLSTPILNPPQSGILGMHAIVKRPVAVEDEVVIRPMMNLALSYDHRIVDGKNSIEFLVDIKKNLEDPTRFLLDLQ